MLAQACWYRLFSKQVLYYSGINLFFFQHVVSVTNTKTHSSFFVKYKSRQHLTYYIWQQQLEMTVKLFLPALNVTTVYLQWFHLYSMYCYSPLKYSDKLIQKRVSKMYRALRHFHFQVKEINYKIIRHYKLTFGISV